MNKTQATAVETAAKARAQSSLLDCLGAVQQAIASMPEVPADARNSRDAFMLTDPILSMVNKQILDARSNMAKLAAMFGLGDPMLEALTLQISALEAAYAERLALLKRKREESTRKNIATHKLWTEEKSTQDVRLQAQADRRRNNGTLWLWAALILRERMTSVPKFGHVPNAA